VENTYDYSNGGDFCLKHLNDLKEAFLASNVLNSESCKKVLKFLEIENPEEWES